MGPEPTPLKTIYRLPRCTGVWQEDYRKERNDCTVRALANSTNTPYGTAHYYLQCFGRKHRKGFAIQTHLRDVRTNYHNFTFKELTLINKMWFERGPKMTIRKFLEKFAEPNKSYICVVTRHAFAIVKGLVYDNCCSPNQQLREVFEVINPQEKILLSPP